MSLSAATVLAFQPESFEIALPTGLKLPITFKQDLHIEDTFLYDTYSVCHHHSNIYVKGQHVADLMVWLDYAHPQPFDNQETTSEEPDWKLHLRSPVQIVGLSTPKDQIWPSDLNSRLTQSITQVFETWSKVFEVKKKPTATVEVRAKSNFKGLRLRTGSTIRIKNKDKSFDGYSFARIAKVTDTWWTTEDGLCFCKTTGKSKAGSWSIVDQYRVK